MSTVRTRFGGPSLLRCLATRIIEPFEMEGYNRRSRLMSSCRGGAATPGWHAACGRQASGAGRSACQCPSWIRPSALTPTGSSPSSGRCSLPSRSSAPCRNPRRDRRVATVPALVRTEGWLGAARAAKSEIAVLPTRRGLGRRCARRPCTRCARIVCLTRPNRAAACTAGEPGHVAGPEHHHRRGAPSLGRLPGGGTRMRAPGSMYPPTCLLAGRWRRSAASPPRVSSGSLAAPCRPRAGSKRACGPLDARLRSDAREVCVACHFD